MTDRIDSAAGCPDAERLAAFIDGRLPAAERQQIEEHLADCAACYDLFVEAARIGVSLQERGGLLRFRPPRRTLLVSAAGLATAAAVWMMVAPPAALVRLWDRRSRPELAEMVEAVGDTRRIEARITGGFAWGPVQAPTRAGEEAPDVPPEVQIAAGRLALRVEGDRSASTLAALGAGQLAAGRIDPAVDALEEAVALDANMAAAWSDLGAALLARSTLAGHAAEVPHALEVIGNALERDPDLPEARFNRALAFERMGLIENAIAAWEEYLAIDDSSAWAVEARSRLAELRKRQQGSTHGDLQPLRERLFDDVLPRWAERTLAGDGAGADAALAEARRLRDALTAASPDTLAANVVAHTEDPSRALLGGLVAYGRGRGHYVSNRFDAAALAFDEAIGRLDDAGSPLALSARLYRAIVKYRANAPGAAEEDLVQLLPAAKAASYPSLTGRIAWMLGVLAVRRGAYLESEQWYRLAQSAFVHAREAGNEDRVVVLLAANEERRGGLWRSWDLRLPALARDGGEGILLESALSALRAGWPRVAALLQQRAAALARARRDLPNEIDALRLQALTYATVGERDAAARLIAEARRLLDSGEGYAWRESLQAEVDLVEAWNADAATAPAALEAAARAVEYFSSADARAAFRLREALIARARVLRLAGALDAARTNLDRVFQILATERAGLSSPAERLRFADTVERLERELVEVEIARGNPMRAIEAVDGLRSWDLHDPSGLTEIDAARQQLDDDVVILAYVVGDSDTYVWALTRADAAFARLGVTRDELQRLARAIGPGRFDSRIARRLYDLALRPVAHVVAPAGRLIIVADTALFGLPFALLPGRAERYLIQEHTIAAAPSVGAAMASANAPRGRKNGRLTVLAVGNPRVDPELHPDLPGLRGARAEAEAVSRVYSAAHLLLDEQATSEAVAAHVGDADVLHFGGHAVVNDLHPEESYLAVFGADRQPITAQAIATLDAPRLRLVVLAACQSLGKQTGARSTPISLARAFLQAGVPAVVANRWPVDDRASAVLTTKFHREYVSTGDPGLALQRAQLSLIQSADAGLQDPAAWAGWTIVIGGRDRILTEAKLALEQKE